MLLVLEAVKKVREVEEQTEELIAQAEQEAARMRNDGNVEGKKVYDEIVSDAQEQGRKIMSDALAIAEQEVEKITAQGKVQQEAIVQQAGERKNDTINFVIERIVSMNGDS